MMLIFNIKMNMRGIEGASKWFFPHDLRALGG
jgi:hypothetical protein